MFSIKPFRVVMPGNQQQMIMIDQQKEGEQQNRQSLRMDYHIHRQCPYCAVKKFSSMYKGGLPCLKLPGNPSSKSLMTFAITLRLAQSKQSLSSFVMKPLAGSAIPSGLITVGSNSSTYANLVSSVSTELQLQRRTAVISLVPSQVSNLKSALKLINSRATGSDFNVEGDDQPKLNQRTRRLNYDLHILNDHVQIHAIEAVVLAFHDSEAFEGTLLNDLVDVISVLLQDPPPLEGIQAELYESVRSLESFRQLVEEALSRSNVESAKLLLDDDKFLRDTIGREIKRGKEALTSLVTAVDLLSSIRSRLSSKMGEPWSSLYIKAMSGELRGSTIINDTLLAVRKLPSDAMAELLDILSESKLAGLSTLASDLQRLESEKDSVDPLRSEHDTHHQSLRTTVVAHKVELSKHKSSLTMYDLSYSELVNRIDKTLKDYFQNFLIHPRDLFLHEVLVYDFKSPHREVFAPKPRYALERALSSPRDYLGCSCCKGSQHGLSGTHPATSVLYQLYLESGAIINTSDLWSAFYTIISPEDAEDEEAEQQRALYVLYPQCFLKMMLTVRERALFSRGVAELRYMGMIKNSRRKPDHLAKMLWNGL
ncbi:MAG: hypothetical protein Q9216_000594 [Gyalolechia sp. 2 TL-2023]